MTSLLKALLFALILLASAKPALHQLSLQDGWIELFNGRDLSGWHFRKADGPNGWSIQDGVYVNTPPSTDIMTNQDFYNFEFHVEFRVAEGSNSGVYLRDRYEVQIFDSQGTDPSEEGCGALFRRLAPRLNPCKPTGEWEVFDIRFVGKHLVVHHNATRILDVEDVGPTGTGSSRHRPDAPGALRLQGDHGKVSFRNVRIRPL